MPSTQRAVADLLIRHAHAAVSGETPELEKDPANPLLRGTDGWNRLGIRDPVPVTDPLGDPLDAGELSVYLNGRDRPIPAGGRTCVGRAVWSGGSSWRLDPGPVFEDGPYAAVGSVVRLAAGCFALYYSPATDRGLAVAMSRDGIRWVNAPGLLLTVDQFGVHRMGLPYVVRHGSRWLMVFEATRQARFGIYGATSANGLSWEPLHRGSRLYEPTPDRWDGYAQANPSLHIGSHGHAAMIYNGSAGNVDYDVGVLLAPHPLSREWLALDQPLLRRGDQAQAWDGRRLEGARPVLDPLDSSCLALLYFGLPTEDSYAGGGIGLARWRSTQS